MNGNAVRSIALALCCLLAIGTSATSLESAVSTSPSEVINVDYASLPIDSNDAERLRQRIEGVTSAEPNAESASSASAEQGDERAKKRARQREEPERQAQRSGGSSEKHQSQQKKQKRKQKQQQNGGQESGSNPPEESLLDRLLDLLADLLALFIRAVPLLFALAAVAVLFRHRRRLASRLRALLGVPRSEDEGGEAALGDPTPGNEVERAWFEMVAGLGLERDPTRTPRECARRAVDAGLDRQAVGTLTEAFEAVRYGDEPPTEEWTTRARESIRHLREQGFGGGSA